MSLTDILLHRRARGANTPRCTQGYQPRAELLEERQCLSVTAPANLQLTALSATQVKLNWGNVAGESGFRVFRWDGTNTILVTSVGANVTTFTVGALQPNQTQWFTVESFDFSSSARSAWASVRTPANPITVPTNLKVGTISQTQMTLTWTNATGATGYRIFSWDGVRANQIGTTTPTVPAFTVRNLTPGVTYFFYVQAFNATNFANTDWVSGTTTTYGLGSPPNFKAQVVSASTIALSWNNVTNETGYKVYRWNGITGSSPILISTLPVNTIGYQAIGLLPGKTYWFYVQAFNATQTANSIWVTATTTAAIPLQAPTQVTVELTSPNSVKITWTEPARAVGYRVYVWTGNAWSVVATVPRGTHQVPVGSLATFRTQWFMVEAFTDNFAEIAYSDAVYINL